MDRAAEAAILEVAAPAPPRGAALGALEPLELFRGYEDVGRVGGAGKLAAARAMTLRKDVEELLGEHPESHPIDRVERVRLVDSSLGSLVDLRLSSSS